MLHETPFSHLTRHGFAHDGQGFPTWHRLYMLAWERTLQEISNDENIANPFQDWTGSKTQCDPAIC